MNPGGEFKMLLTVPLNDGAKGEVKNVSRVGSTGAVGINDMGRGC